MDGLVKKVGVSEMWNCDKEKKKIIFLKANMSRNA